MKQTFKIIAVVFGIGLLIYYFKARYDYSWADTKIEEAKKERYILIAELKSSSILKPWTWFKKPITEVWFTKPSELARIDSSIIIGHIWKYMYRDKPEFEQYYVLYNSLLYSSHVIENRDSLFIRNHAFDKLKWTIEEPNTPGGKILEYFSSKNKYYYMINVWGKEIDISNYIITGLYSPIGSGSKCISELINNNPYIPTEKDEPIIRDGVSKWIRENYPNVNFTLEPKMFKKVKYKSSHLGIFNNIIDVYTLVIVPSIKIGRLELEFNFSRFSVPSEYFKEDKVLIHNQIEITSGHKK